MSEATTSAEPTPDATAPIVTPIATGVQSPSGWFTSSVHVTWTYSDDESPAKVADGCAETDIDADTTAAVLTCTAVSAGGSTTGQITINRDATAPTIVCPTLLTLVQSAVGVLSASVEDAGSGPGAAIITVPAPTDTLGPAHVQLTATDIAGNAATALCGYDVQRDTSAPTIRPVVTGVTGDNGWFTSDVTVSFAVEDLDSPILSTTGCEPQIFTTDTAAGTATCQAASNGGEAVPATAAFARDATAPQLSCPATAPSVIRGGTGQLTASVTDATSGTATPTVTAALDSSTAGPAVVQLSASDLAGNVGGVQCGYTVLDLTPPVVTSWVEGPTAGPAQRRSLIPEDQAPAWYTGDVTVHFDVFDPDSPVLETMGCAPVTISEDTAGATATCTARSYGEGVGVRSVTIARDATAPVITCPAPPIFVQGSAQTLTAQFSDATSGTTSSGETVAVDTTVVGLRAGSVTATDVAGNSASADCAYEVVADPTPPVITATIEGTSLAPGWYSGPVSVSFAVDDPDSPLRTREGCDITVVAQDTASQTFTCSAQSWGPPISEVVTIQRDSVAPTVTCMPLAFVRGAEGTVSATVRDATSGVTAPSVSATADTSTAGRKYAVLVATDLAGNVSSQRCAYDVLEPAKVSASRLSTTGSNVRTPVVAGIVLALAGVLLALAARRRTGHSKDGHSNDGHSDDGQSGDGQSGDGRHRF